MTDISIKQNDDCIIITVTNSKTQKIKVDRPVTVKQRAPRKIKQCVFSQTERVVLEVLEDSVSGLAPRRISNMTGYSVQTVYASINKLKAIGYRIHKAEGWGGKYRLINRGYKHGA
jgi:hypothetical protein